MSLNSCGEDAPRSLSDIVLEELSMSWCRESGELAPLSAPLQLGAVLALDAAGRYVPYMTELTPAVEAVPAVCANKAVAVLISKKIPASEEAQPCTVLRRGCCVAVDNLDWLPSVSEDQKKTALGQLAALGIVPKE
ncbi:head decoration protein [Desulfovibrio sp. ZJ369]|uniref:head decoration protein n=1 Tax=Desulfovibrio sp. ZJ369 TaxID=2709793 RepID=UPI0013EB1B19|nr:head decoration protein [Desulfovibrio sp. ZJ369]